MTALVILLLSIAFIYLAFMILKPYFIKVDNVSLYTGSLGTGKTLTMVKQAVKKYHFNLSVVRFKNMFRSKSNKIELPRLYSNFGITTRGLFKVKDISYQITEGILLLTERVPQKSVIVISEFGSLASQFEWNNENALDNLDEFMRFYRQYTHGGYIFIDDQASDNIILQCRRRAGKVYNMQEFKKYPIIPFFFYFYVVRIRHMSISEDIKVIETQHSEDNENSSVSYGLLNPFRMLYDTYAFSERYNSVPEVQHYKHTSFKNNEVIQLPKADKKNFNRVEKQTTSDNSNLPPIKVSKRSKNTLKIK